MTRSSPELHHEVSDGVLVVRAVGRFDADAGRAVEELVLAHDGPRVLNLAGVDYISSSGVANLVKLHTSRRVQIACAAQCVRDVLGLAGIERLLTLHDTEEAARDAHR